MLGWNMKWLVEVRVRGQWTKFHTVKRNMHFLLSLFIFSLSLEKNFYIKILF